MNEDLQKAIDSLDKGDFNPSTWAIIKKALSGNGDESWTAEQQKGLLDKFRDWASSSPEAQKQLKEHLRDTATQRFTKQYKPFFNAILQGADLATSLSQIQTSNNALKSIAQPAVAGSPGEPQALKAQLANAQQGGLAAARAIAPAKQTIEQQYQNDINNAKNISGGNAASFMANAQVASLAKERAAAALPAIQDTIQNRYQSRADQLASALASNQQQDFGNRLYGSQLSLDQYNRQMQAAGLLGSTGRLNLRNTLQSIPNTITGIMGQASPAGYGSTPPTGQIPAVTGQMVDYPQNPDKFGRYSDYYKDMARGMFDNNTGSKYTQPSYLPPSNNIY